MLSFSKDLRYALRTLTKNPGFAVVGIATLALGMAVNTTLFAVINGFILRPLPVPHPEQMTVIALKQTAVSTNFRFSHPEFEDLRNQSDSFSDIFAYTVTLAAISVDHKADHSIITRVSNNYFSSLGIAPAVGRFILPSEGLTPGADPVIVLGYSYWRRRFAADPGVIGQKVALDDHPFTVVGVAPRDFHGTYSVIDTDAYVPFSADIFDDPDSSVQKFWTSRVAHPLTLMGRLKPGVSIKQAEASLNVVAQRTSQAHPDFEKGISVQVFPEKLARPEPDPDNSIPNAAIAFMGLAALVLLVACFNIANVLLVRATVRQREMAIRAALGAGQVRLVCQYLTESLLLALLGGAGGLLLATWAAGFLGSISLGTELPFRLDFHPDARVYAFSLGAVLLTGLIVGTMPALRVARTSVISVLHEGGRGSSAGPRRQLARNVLVVAQVAGSFVLLIVAGLFVRSLNKAEKMNLGFNPDHVLDFSVDLGQIGTKETEARQEYRQMEERIRALPGVESVAQCFIVPMGYVGAGNHVWIQDHPYAADEQPPDISYNTVSSGYFDTLQIPLLRGRKIADSDTQTSPAVAVINQNMAQKFWPNEDALGKQFSTHATSGPFIQVVGIVQNGKYQNLTEDPQPYFYLPLEQSYNSTRTFHVRTSVPPESVAPEVQSLVHEFAPDVPITEVKTMTEALQGANGFFLFRFGAQLTAVMGLLGLVLAVVGIYSVVSYAAAQRTQEFGIRVAMGASARDILRMVLRQGLGVIGIGLGVGLLISLAGTRILAGLFIGVKPSDPVTFSTVVLFLTSIALLACWIPARRATRIDPLVALRHE